MSSLFVGDTGTELVLNCGVDISSATVRKVRVRKPGGQSLEWVAAPHSATEIVYTLLDGDLSVAGTWKFQAYIEMPGWKGRGEWAEVTVLA